MLHFEVLVRANARDLTVSVFMKEEDKQAIKNQSIVEASRFLNELGVNHDINDLKPIGYRNKGKWPLF